MMLTRHLTLFGLAAGPCDLFTGHPQRGVILQAVLGTLWGIPCTGFFLFHWPLACLNHPLLRSIASAD